MGRPSGRSGDSHARHDRDGYEDEYANYGARDRYDDNTGERDAYTGAYDAYDSDYDSRESAAMSGRALVPLGDSASLPVAADDEEERGSPLVIPGTGQSMGTAFLPRRERPLLMRLAVIGLTVCVVVSGLFAVVPLGGTSQDVAGATPFQALANAVVLHTTPDFFWYTVLAGDTVDSLAQKFNCQVGGLYELNGMLSGEELQLGKAYKIPKDPNYGLYYRPPSFVGVAGFGATTYTDNPWTSMAGNPPEGALCAPIPTFYGGDASNMANYDLSSYKLYAPNPGAWWVRGFTYYHFGDDLAQPMGAPIYASQAGEVIFSGWDPGGGGWTIKVNNCNHVSTFYAHMETLIKHVHDMVHPGDILGLEGSTGNSTGPHLHFQIEWNNVPVDPLLFYGKSQYNIIHNAPPIASPTPSTTATPGGTPTAGGTPTS
jgi:LysM repeat protein